MSCVMIYNELFQHGLEGANVSFNNTILPVGFSGAHGGLNTMPRTVIDKGLTVETTLGTHAPSRGVA